MLLGIDQFPRPFGLGVFSPPLVVPFEPIPQVVGRANVIGSVLLALKDIKMIGHFDNKKACQVDRLLNSGGSDETRTRDLPA